MSTALSDSSIPEHARRLLEAPQMRRRDLALAFAPSSAASAEVLVGGPAFYPALLADIENATSSVHINQFGFRPGHVGDAFAEALVAKAAEGVPVRLVVDRNGSDPGGRRVSSTTGSSPQASRCVRAGDELRAPSARSAAAARPAGTSPASATSITAR